MDESMGMDNFMLEVQKILMKHYGEMLEEFDEFIDIDDLDLIITVRTNEEDGFEFTLQ